MFVVAIMCSINSFIAFNNIIRDRDRKSRNYAEWLATLSDEDVRTVERLHASFNDFISSKEGGKSTGNRNNKAD